MEVEYIKGLGCPVNIIWGNKATAITITDAKQLQAKLAQVIEQAENEQEPELSEFEKALEVFLMNADSSEETFHEEVKKHAAELLSLARDQFIEDGYVLEKKTFHDAVGKVSPEVMKEVSDKVDMEEALRLEYEKGRADVLKEIEQDPESSYDAFKRGFEYGKEEALKDLPRWRKGIIPKGELAIRQVGISQHAYGVKRGGVEDSTPPTQRYILISELEKLPKDE